MILILDNRDSFTFNLAESIRAQGQDVRVVRSTAIGADEALGLGVDGLLVGPGPGTPKDAGSSEELIRGVLADPTAPPLLGICLGHQALATALGGRLNPAATLVHGAARPVDHDGLGLLEGLASPVPIARYNSLVVDPESLPKELTITAKTEDGDIAGLRVEGRPMESLQGHPESILCLEEAAVIFRNFVAATRRHRARRP